MLRALRSTYGNSFDSPLIPPDVFKGGMITHGKSRGATLLSSCTPLQSGMPD
ncbi:hypothetical protein [Solemya velum gill symbiont]|uniref:hypothetical protein n=1 Tax=Solemya velum gill symbiont TaxID=2340 RepID=UPI001E4F66CB|nr:hypothetical protein [Solemya velum gill symbiont]